MATIILASHGEFAQGLKQTATMIIGDSVPIHALSAFRDEDESILVQIKKLLATIDIEETHPLGRLFDMDVYDKTGNGISREQLGAPPRRCLLCGQGAKSCGRSRSHTIEELYARVEDIISSWLKKAR